MAGGNANDMEVRELKDVVMEKFRNFDVFLKTKNVDITRDIVGAIPVPITVTTDMIALFFFDLIETNMTGEINEFLRVAIEERDVDTVVERFFSGFSPVVLARIKDVMSEDSEFSEKFWRYMSFFHRSATLLCACMPDSPPKPLDASEYSSECSE